MRHIVVILFVIAATAAIPGKSRIWGGLDATFGQFPYAVAINDYDSQLCGGVIIAPNWILTSAKCLFYLSPTARVYVGSQINHINGTAYIINDIIVHEGFNSSTAKDDIGLIKLDTNLVFDDAIQAIELGEVVAPNTTCTAIGWGSTQNDTFQDILHYVELTTIDMDLCLNISANQSLNAYLGPEQICTLAPEGQGVCYGDTGGPLVCDGKLAGIVSYTVGYYECGIQLPDVYTSIQAYLNWILAAIQP